MDLLEPVLDKKVDLLEPVLDKKVDLLEPVLDKKVKVKEEVKKDYLKNKYLYIIMNFQKHKNLIILLVVTILAIYISLYAAFYTVNKKREEKGEIPLTFIKFINNDKKISLKQIIVGMSFGMIFGFIDNFGLWYGMDYLDPYLPNGNLTKAGFGNTYSDFIGSTMGTSISIILTTLYPVEEAPIWVNSFGIIVGCLLGLYIPKYLSGRS